LHTRLKHQRSSLKADLYKNTCSEKSLKIPKGGNQNPYIEKEQTTQWPKEKSTKGQTTIYKTYILN
jgi:hypothetical protein